MAHTEQTSKFTFRISPYDASDLRWYFKEGLRRLEMPSNMQRQLDRLQLYFKKAKPCTKCGGDPKTLRSGCGFVSSGKPSSLRPATPRELELLALIDIDPSEVLNDELCPVCRGKGWVQPSRSSHSKEPITARPTGSSRHGSVNSSGGDSDNLAKLGRISRRLGMVKSNSSVAYVVLEAYFAPDGGDLESLWHLTPSGKTMQRNNPHNLPHKQLYANLKEAQRQQPNDIRRKQFERATEDAKKLLDHAVLVWKDVTCPPPRASEVDSLSTLELVVHHAK